MFQLFRWLPVLSVISSMILYTDAKISCYICSGCTYQNYGQLQRIKEDCDYCKTYSSSRRTTYGEIFTRTNSYGLQYPLNSDCGTSYGLQSSSEDRYRCCNTNLCNSISFSLQDEETLTAADNAHLNHGASSYDTNRFLGGISLVLLFNF